MPKSTPTDFGRLLLTPPKAYLSTAATVHRFEDLSPTEPRVISVTLADLSEARSKRPYLRVTLRDDGGTEAQIKLYGGSYVWRRIPIGSSVRLRAKRAWMYGTAYISSPTLVLSEDEVEPVYRSGRIPVVTGVEGETAGRRLTPAGFRAAVQRGMAHSDQAVSVIAKATGLTEKELAVVLRVPRAADWVRLLHRPRTRANAERVTQDMRRLVMLEAQHSARQLRSVAPCPDTAIRIDVAELVSQCPSAFGFPLTDSQASALAHIGQSLDAPTPMRSMLTAEVGAGKSAVFLSAAFGVVRAGFDAVIMTPRDLLVDDLVRLSKAAAPDVETYRVKPGKALPRGVAGALYIGTSAVITALQQHGVRPRLVVVDEQHKFGLADRLALLGPRTHLLEVSATPIPRSLGVLLAGGLDLVAIEGTPFERQITTKLLQRRSRVELFRRIKTLLASPEGHQVAAVYPRIDTSADADESTRLEPMLAFWRKHFGDQVAVIHGRMSVEAQAIELARLQSKQARVLVATTAIELGVTIPSLRAMLIVEPEAFGLTQLHQLRGRLARHGGRGVFWMLPAEDLGPDQEARLRLLEQHSSGFDLADAELDQRGVGDLGADAEAQSGRSLTLFKGVTLSANDVRAIQALD